MRSKIKKVENMNGSSWTLDLERCIGSTAEAASTLKVVPVRDMHVLCAPKRRTDSMRQEPADFLYRASVRLKTPKGTHGAGIAIGTGQPVLKSFGLQV